MINTTKTEYLNFLTNLQKNFGNEYEISTEKIFNRISILIENPKTHRPIGFYKLLKIDENTYDLLGFKPFKNQNWQHNNETLKLRTLVKTQRPFLLPTILYNSRRKRRKKRAKIPKINKKSCRITHWNYACYRTIYRVHNSSRGYILT